MTVIVSNSTAALISSPEPAQVIEVSSPGPKGDTGLPRLWESGVIDLKTAGATTIYTVPAGQWHLFDAVELVILTAAGVTVAPTIKIGSASAHDEFMASTQIDTTTAGDRFIAEGPFNALTAGESLRLEVVTPATASGGYTARVIARGFPTEAP